MIRPFDPGTIKDIEKAIQAGDLGFNPQSDGRVVRVIVPPLSMEVRRKMVARIRDLCEESKVAIRNVRRDGNKVADQSEKDKVSEDERDDVKERSRNSPRPTNPKPTTSARTGKKRSWTNRPSSAPGGRQ